MAKSVYLSPSTQEKNVGKGNYGTEEKRCNQICDIVEETLIRHKIKVFRNDINMSIQEVVKDSNLKNANIHFAIHTNAWNKKTRGSEIFCHRYGIQGHELAKKVYSKISSLTPTEDRGIKEGKNFYGLGNHMYEIAYTKMPASLIEIDFHDNNDSAKWIINNISKIGIAIAKGILEYFEIKYINLKLYVVQCGAFSNIENANNLISGLNKHGFDGIIKVIKNE